MIRTTPPDPLDEKIRRYKAAYLYDNTTVYLELFAPLPELALEEAVRFKETWPTYVGRPELIDVTCILTGAKFYPSVTASWLFGREIIQITMTQDEFMKAALSGQMVLIAEFRNTNAEVIRWRGDKGESLTAPICNHGLEIGNNQISLGERLPDGADAKNVQPPFARGTKVVLHLQTLTREKGAYKATGTMERLEESAVSGRVPAKP